MDIWIIVAGISCTGLIVWAFWFFFYHAKKKSLPPPPQNKIEVPEVSWTDRLKRGLTQTRSEIWGKIGQLLTLSSVNKAELEQIEELLYSSDIGPKLVNELLEKIKSAAPVSGGNIDFKQLLASFIREKMEKIQSTVTTKSPEQKSGFPHSIMVVGVNGAGKTTTIGKLATKFTKEGARVIVGACDTFRAAAVDQLQVWCERAGAEMVRASGSSRPSGVAYEALQKAINGQADYCILDTAGRLHTEENLMEELKKTKNVLAKLDPKAPNEVWLVLDAITGQNAIRQAIEFNNTLKLTGLIFTKCDSSSKAGGAIAIVEQLAVPIVYIGVGESVEDINSFNLNDYISALLG